VSEQIIFTFPVGGVIPLSCAWIDTGNPAGRSFADGQPVQNEAQILPLLKRASLEGAGFAPDSRPGGRADVI